MEHVAIDLGGRESQICVRASDGTIVEERRSPTRRLEEYLASRPMSRVILETTSEAFAIADAAKRCGHQVVVVPAALVRSLGVGARGIKTDRRDAQALSQVSCRIDLPSVHIPSEQAREWRAILNSRDALVRSRTLLINSVRGWLRKRTLRIRSGDATTFPRRVRDTLLETPLGVPMHLETELAVVEALNAQLKPLGKELARLAKENPVAARLMSVPGVGPLTALRFVSTIDDVTRFAGAHQVGSYLGLTPGERSSSDRVHRTGITRAGSSVMRWLLVEAAWRIRRQFASHPMAIWATAVEHRRGKHVAVTALARKLAGVLFALWRDGTTYQPRRGARSEEVTTS